MALNVNRGIEDTFYRYKMPKLNAKVEGKGNGIKTVIVNVSDIAKALSRKPIYVTKYFGCELGAQIYVDDKNDRYIVNGAHESQKLQEILDGFIKKFVLCQGCGNPETNMHVQKKPGTVSTLCKACGFSGQLDVTHRLTQFIVKNPPEAEAAQATGKSKKGKRNKVSEKPAAEPSPLVNGGDVASRRSPEGDNDDADDWCEDTTEEAQRQRMNELSGMARSLAVSVAVEKPESERAQIFGAYLVQLKQSDEVLSSKKEIQQQAEELELGPKVVLVIAEALLSSPDDIMSDIQKYAPIFMLFTRIGIHKERTQYYVLLAMSKLIERYAEHNLLNKACHMLKQLYDCDVIEEDTILSWAAKGPSKKIVSKELSEKILCKCAPMIKWLKEADEEEESDDEEEETESQDEVTHHSRDGSIEQSASDGNVGEDQSEDDEIDIDAI